MVTVKTKKIYFYTAWFYRPYPTNRKAPVADVDQTHVLQRLWDRKWNHVMDR